MARQKTKTRLSVSLAQHLYEALEKDAQEYGVSLASYCSFIIGQHYATKERMLQGVNNQVNDIMAQMKNDLNKF